MALQVVASFIIILIKVPKRSIFETTKIYIMTKTYPCSLDKIARYTPLFVIGLAAFIVVNFFYFSGHSNSHRAHMLIPIGVGVILLPGAVIVLYFLRTQSVTINETNIVINRTISPVKIPLSEISSVQKPEDMQFAMRTMGNGGVFGYTGKYYKKGIGSMTWYCTQRQNYVLIEKTNGKKIVVTPDDADGFIQQISVENPGLVTGV